MAAAASNWIIGGLFLCTASLSAATWFTDQALFGNIISFCAFSWCIHKKGHMFVAIPTCKLLSIGIAATTGIIFLGDTLHVGSVIGAIVIKQRRLEPKNLIDCIRLLKRHLYWRAT